jgi:hypothetical protein
MTAQEQPPEPQFPCAICREEVTWEDDAIQCDGCEYWLHRNCIGMSLDEYARLGLTTSCWICCECGLMNISTSLFKGSTIPTANIYQPLADTTIDSEFSLGSVTSPGIPTHTSSPNKAAKETNKTRRKSLRILNVNCQSLVAKKIPFNHMVNRMEPDVIIGTESWLHKDIADNDCLPTSEYSVERRDREGDPHGGVFIATKRDLIMEREYELEADCELLWCEINLVGTKTIHIGAYYRPHEKDEESLAELEKSLQRLGSNTDNVLLAGDFNFPSWDWKSKTLKPNCNYPTLHYRFGNILDDHSLTQVVEEPTRDKNTLDLIATSIPSKVNSVQVIPGISDHDIPMVELDTQPIRRTQKPRTIPLYKRANWDTLAQEMAKVDEEMKNMPDDTSADEKWTMFRDALQAGIKNHIPMKTCKKKDNLPYINSEIKKLIKKRDRAYKQRKKAQRNFEHSMPHYEDKDKKYKDLKHLVQKKLRDAYWNYIESIIAPMDPENPYTGMKKFWTLIKSLRKDYSGVAPLKEHGKTSTENPEKANILNRQFESVFTREKTITPDLLPETSPFRPMADIEITTNGVQKMLEKLNIHKATGPDGISPCVLRNLATTIAPILTNIFRPLYEQGAVPEDWKKANVSPIFKKGKKNSPSNYRPISLTCVSCKLMEHIITSNIMRHARDPV